jgi:hypothetical protein
MDAKSGGLVDLFKGVDIIRNRNLAYYGMSFDSAEDVR